MSVFFACHSDKQLITNILGAHGDSEDFFNLRDASYQIEVLDVDGKKGSHRFMNAIQFETERCTMQVHCKREMFLFSFPFKLKDKGYTFRRLKDETLFGTLYHVVRACFESQCMNMFYTMNNRLAMLEVNDPVMSGPVLIRFSYQRLHNFYVADKREIFVKNDVRHEWQIARIELLSDIRFWIGLSDEDFIASNNNHEQ